jgi:hypothetical protein
MIFCIRINLNSYLQKLKNVQTIFLMSSSKECWRYDTQHNDIQHDDTQHNDIQHKNK